MARYNGPVSRLCRREGMKLYLKGSKCYTKKCPFERRPTPPGQHGIRRRKMSEYGVQLREKQKVRRVYGILERQFKHYFETAESRPGVTGENLLRLLETRLDNTVFRMGFATSRAQARQLVNHGHFAVNGRATDIPSFRLKEGDVVSVRDGSAKSEYFKNAKDTLRSASRPDWLTADADKLAGSVTTLPSRDQMPAELNEQLVVEYYSR
ncbi:MAG: 30S ribosomal protein S4 [Candidatus Limnocylindrales bacterium]